MHSVVRFVSRGCSRWAQKKVCDHDEESALRKTIFNPPLSLCGMRGNNNKNNNTTTTIIIINNNAVVISWSGDINREF